MFDDGVKFFGPAERNWLEGIVSSRQALVYSSGPARDRVKTEGRGSASRESGSVEGFFSEARKRRNEVLMLHFFFACSISSSTRSTETCWQTRCQPFLVMPCPAVLRYLQTSFEPPARRWRISSGSSASAGHWARKPKARKGAALGRSAPPQARQRRCDKQGSVRASRGKEARG